MTPEPFDWSRFHSYRVFDEFLERLLLQRKSYVTKHPQALDLVEALDDIRARFVAGFDDSDSRFEEKVALQFKGASRQTLIVFANIEYLWAMPMENISPARKRSYAQRWFEEADQVHSGNRYFFDFPHIIANPGSWYLRNKYWELIAAFRVLSLACKDPGLRDVPAIKARIAEICHQAVYEGVPPDQDFAVSKVCGIHSALMHLSDPERYESIISTSHRKQICAVFGHVVEQPSPDAEVLLKQIRRSLFDSHGVGVDADRKYRWFFYSKDVLPLWIDKKSRKAQQVSSGVFDVMNEENAADLEGSKEAFNGYRIRRSAKLVKAAKVRDGHACRACGFHFDDQIVHVHHLDPLSEYKRPQETKLEDLITLCPNCHFLAHYWLRTDSRFKQVESLLDKLREVTAD